SCWVVAGRVFRFLRFVILLLPPLLPLFPYTTLFRSGLCAAAAGPRPAAGHDGDRRGADSGLGDRAGRGAEPPGRAGHRQRPPLRDRKSTRLNSSHGSTSYAVFCLKKKRTTQPVKPAM